MDIKRIFFVHTVGTAGGDFSYYLQHLYNPKSFICAPDIKRKNDNKLNSPILRSKYIKDLLIEQYRARTKKGDQIDLIYGHIPYLKDYRSIFHKDFQLMTLVRNPVKRFVTHYRKLIYKNNSLKDFKKLSSELTSSQIDIPFEPNYMNFNLQTAFISGFNHHGTAYAKMTDEVFNIAKKNISEFAFVGVADYFDESVKLFSKITSKKYIYIKPLKKYKSKNVFPIDPDILKYIEEKSYYDFLLYKYAKEIFFKKVKECDDIKLIKSNNFDNLVICPLKRINLISAKMKAKIKNNFLNQNIHI